MDPPDADPLFDEISLESLRRRRSEKWSRFPPDVLPSFVAELDFAPAPPIATVLTRAIAEGDLGYALAGRSGLARAFAGFADRRWGWAVDPGSVVAVPDVMVGVAELLRLVAPSGSGVVFVTPSYPPFFSVIAEAGRRAVPVPLLDHEAGPRLPLEAIRSAFEAGSRVLLLCNPHNPTGYVATREELRAIVNIAGAHDAVVLSDEIHAAHQPAARAAESAVEQLVGTMGAVAVVHVHRPPTQPTGPVDRRLHVWRPVGEAAQQDLAVLVVERLDDIDESGHDRQGPCVRSMGPVAPESCSRQRGVPPLGTPGWQQSDNQRGRGNQTTRQGRWREISLPKRLPETTRDPARPI